jgi:hypothetical protein
VRGPLRRAQNSRKVCTASLHLQRSESRRGPLTLVRSAHSTSPRTRGEVKRAISFSRRSRARVLPMKATKFLPPKNKGRRSAEKAHLPWPCSAEHGRALIAARSPFGAPPRRSPGCYPWLSSGPRFLEPPGANGGTLPDASAASSSRTAHGAGRAGPRSRPGAECVVPPAGTAPAPLSKAPSRRCP